MIYQIDAGCQRRLRVGRLRTEQTPRRGLEELGKEFVEVLRYVCSDMWRPSLKDLAEQAGQAERVGPIPCGPAPEPGGR